MFRMCAKSLLAVMFAVALGGCNPQQFQTVNDPPRPPGTISVHSLAGRLGLRVDQSSRSLASLTGPANRVLILGQPDSQVYVNGRAVGAAGKMLVVNDTLFVPLDLEPQIRAAMRGGQVATILPPQPRDPNKIIAPPLSKQPGAPVHGLVIIDPGHGGKDPGAMRGGLREKDLNLSVALLVVEDLKARGAKVIMTRPNDTFIELDDRADTANRNGADLFLSIHTNSSVKPGICGFAVYVSDSAPQTSVKAATDIAHRMEQGGVPPCGSQPHRAGYRVLVHNHRPAVLLEMGFITNTGDAGNLASPHYQRMLADCVAEGVADYLRGK
jgi:N-acetylmuramoyl-L-alanine amidase